MDNNKRELIEEEVAKVTGGVGEKPAKTAVNGGRTGANGAPNGIKNGVDNTAKTGKK